MAGTEHTDKKLFAQIANGNEQAFEQIFHTYNARLLPFVTSITKDRSVAEEIMQEVFLKLWFQRFTLTEIEKPAAWLVRLSSNLALSWLQRKAIHTRAINTLTKSGQPENSSIESDLDTKLIREHIAVAVNQLPDKRQEVFRLSREGGLNRKEIAERLGVSESTVKNQLGAALKFIQEYLQKHYGIYLPFFLLASLS